MSLYVYIYLCASVFTGILCSTCQNTIPALCGGKVLTLEPLTVYGTCNVNAGTNNDIPKAQVSVAPTVKYGDAEKDSLYLLIVVDPDAGQAKYVLHWLVTDISGSSLQTGNLDGKIRMAYEGPNPPDGQHHRYQFLLYKQESKTLDLSMVKRVQFQLDRFLKNNKICSIATFQYKSF